VHDEFIAVNTVRVESTVIHHMRTITQMMVSIQEQEHTIKGTSLLHVNVGGGFSVIRVAY
jgi:hypothetical protein